MDKCQAPVTSQFSRGHWPARPAQPPARDHPNPLVPARPRTRPSPSGPRTLAAPHRPGAPHACRARSRPSAGVPFGRPRLRSALGSRPFNSSPLPPSPHPACPSDSGPRTQALGLRPSDSGPRTQPSDSGPRTQALGLTPSDSGPRSHALAPGPWNHRPRLESPAALPPSITIATRRCELCSARRLGARPRFPVKGPDRIPASRPRRSSGPRMVSVDYSVYSTGWSPAAASREFI